MVVHCGQCFECFEFATLGKLRYLCRRLSECFCILTRTARARITEMDNPNMRNGGEKAPTVSVIVPNYNHAPYLRQRIDSILEQRFDDFELILLDDCSTDSSRDILESYRTEPRVSKVIFNDANSGSTFAQWRRGLAEARGEYVWIAESDDFAHPDFLATLVGQLRANPEAVLAYSGSIIVDAEGREIPGADWDRFAKTRAACEIYSPEQMIRKNLLRNNQIYNASMALFRRNTAPKIDGRFTAMHFCGDWLFWSELAQRGSAISISAKLNNFRQHAQKVSNLASKQGLTYVEGFEVINSMADFLRLSPFERKVLAGRTWKRLNQYPEIHPDRSEAVRRGFERLLPQGEWRYRRKLILLYEADKFLNFSKLTTGRD